MLIVFKAPEALANFEHLWRIMFVVREDLQHIKFVVAARCLVYFYFGQSKYCRIDYMPCRDSY
jgi:hypothetical protein